LRNRTIAAPTQKEALAEAQQLLEAKEFEAAEQKLAELTAGEKAPVAAYRLHARVLLQLGRGTEALHIVRNGLSAWPRNRALSIVQIDLLRGTFSPEAAHDELLKAAEADPDNGFFQAAVAENWLLNGNVRKATPYINNAARLESRDAYVTVRRAIVLAMSGARDKAAQYVANTSCAQAELLDIFEQTIRSLIQMKRAEQALAMAQAACALLPGSAEPIIWSAEMLLREKRAGDALDQLDRCTVSAESMTADCAFRFLSAKGKALQALGRREEALASFEQALALKPDDEEVLRELYVVAQKLGLEQKRKFYGRRLSGSGGQGLPATLVEGLAALREQKLSVPQTERTRWAWELADKNQWTETEWLDALAWGQAADRLLRSWWLKAHERSGEIDALIDRPEKSVFDELADAKCVCVTTHMGPLAATVRYIQTVGRPFRGYGVAGPDPVIGDAPPMRIAQSGGGDALRQTIEEINKGTLIGFAAEVPDLEKGIALDFLGRTIKISTMVPRLIWKLGAASVWWQALWRDGRIAIETERLPEPQPDETVELWCSRWADAYLERVARVMRGRPENLNLRGIWSNAEQSSGR
jgi:tetratricopeptide (TPR) repeat protein